MKKNYWPIFFIGIFGFTFSMIVWTIKSATSISITPDKSFMKKYQDVDANFNEMMESNKKFLDKFDFEMLLNDNKLLLSTDDIKYSQRVLEKISLHRNNLKVGQNTVKIFVVDKVTKEKKDINIELIISKSIADDGDLLLKNDNFQIDNKTYSSSFQLKDAHNWIITGSFVVDGITGYIYIKTNAI